MITSPIIFPVDADKPYSASATNNEFQNSHGLNKMRATQLLHNLGQSLWLDNITRDLVNSGTLKRYIDELSVTGLTSNPRSSTTRLRIAACTILRSAKGLVTVSPERSCFLSWPLRNSGGPPICSDPSSTALTASTDGYRWRYRHCLLRTNMEQEFVIGGYIPGARGFDALLVGVYERKELIFVAKVKYGFVPRIRDEL